MDRISEYNRQEGLLPSTSIKLPIVLIGAGGIGSPTALALCKMGINNLTIYDDDVVEPHNLPNQIYKLSDIGKKKVDALADMCNEFAETEIETRPVRFDGDIEEMSIVISGVDSMESRKQIWEHIKMQVKIPLYIDARMGGEYLTIYAVNPTNLESIKNYEKSLHSDEEAEPIPCTERAIIYNVFWVASMVAHRVKQFYTGEMTLYESLTFDFPAMFLRTTSGK